MRHLNATQLLRHFPLARKAAVLLSMLLAGACLTLLFLSLMPIAPATPAYANDPTFMAHRSFGPGNDFTISIVVGDMNGDGHLDLIVGNFGTASNTVYLNDGTGNFPNTSPYVRTFGAGATQSVAVGDVDGDGDLDIVVGNTGQASKVYLNDGVGNFYIGLVDCATPPATVHCFGSSEFTRSVALGDVNGDGALDIVQGNYGQPGVVYLNDGAGNFYYGAVTCAEASVRCFGSGLEHTASIALGDVNGDGDLDVVVGNSGIRDDGSCHCYFGEQNVVYLNDGTGHFPNTAPYTRTFGTGSDATKSVAVGDVNGDGAHDLITGNFAQQNVVYLNDGTGNFPNTNPYTRTFSAGSDATQSVTAGDVDGDGDLDLVTGNAYDLYPYHGEQNVVYLNDGAGYFTATTGLNFGTGIDTTYSVAAGDMDRDGDLDLIVGNAGQNALYLNAGAGSFSSTSTSAHPFGTGSDDTWSVATGDMDGDGHLDLVVGNGNMLVFSNSVSLLGRPNAVYLNNGTGDFPNSNPYTRTFGTGSNVTWGVAVGDMNGDGHLDIVTSNYSQTNVVYLNDGLGNFPNTSAYTRTFGTDLNHTLSVALGDIDGDGDLDIVTGNAGLREPESGCNCFRGEQNVIYLNDGAGNFPNTSTSMRLFGTGSDATASVAVGDMNGDGALDIVAGNNGQQNVVYLNDGAGNFDWPGSARNFGTGFDNTLSAVVGDMNGDGLLDIVAGKNGQQSVVYLNDGAGNFDWPGNARDFGVGGDYTRSVVVADVDGDGDLDLITGNEGQNMVYLNDGTGNFPVDSVRDFGTGLDITWSMAAGDMDGDGDLDLVTGNLGQQNIVYLNNVAGAAALVNNPPQVGVVRPGPTHNASGYSTPVILGQRFIPITYTLADPENDPVRFIRTFYSPEGGSNWLPALDASGTVTANLSASFTGTTHTFVWDTFASGFFGQSDNVVFRIEAYSSLRTGPNGIPVFQHPYASATTFPFRVRGTQVRVMSGTMPATNALVYRLPVSDTVGGALMGNATAPFHTDGLGYLQGRGELKAGDQLFALVPITWTDSYTLYYTSGTPNATGVNAFTVGQAGVQTLTVSSTRPLVLFNLNLSLEWDATNDPTYLDQMQFNLQRASEYLYDFSDGQAALGHVTIEQNADDWAYSNIVVHATNRMRPFAIQGGLVTTMTVDPQHSDIVYDSGQVHIGASWNRYGAPGQSIGEDWPVILAHELSHYLFYLDDTYLGLDANGYLRAVNSCTGSAMGDVYSPDNTEFVWDVTAWNNNCAQTLTQQTLGRDEWETIHLWYPSLVTPTTLNPGPSLMPFDFTTIDVLAPLTPTDALADPSFYLDYVSGAISSGEARAFLLRSGQYVIDLGNPLGGQNRVIARGAQPGDQLCVFDQLRGQFGCEPVTLGDDRVQMERDVTWTPLVQLSPVTSQTFGLQVTNLPTGLTLQARLYPEYGPGGGVIALSPVSNGYSGTFNLSKPTLAGHVQVWVNETATEANPRRETITAFAIGGNPGIARSGGGIARSGGGIARSGGGIARSGGGIARSGGAPLMSPDGQLIFFTANPEIFEVGDFYTIQNMAGLPSVPPGRTVIGQGYSLVAAPGTPILTGSVSIQYLTNDVLAASADENRLTLYYYDGSIWHELPTVRDEYFNLATAPSQGPGVYALMASVQVPLRAPGWNLFAYPLQETQPVSDALRSIDGQYALVYGYITEDTNDPWKVYAGDAPGYVNDLVSLELGRGYWISATQAVTIHFSSLNIPVAANALFPAPPSTFYGVAQGALAGQVVIARINGQACGQGVTQDYEGQIVYVVSVFADDGAGYAGCGAPGRTVTFSVASHSMSPTGAWDNNALHELALTPGTPGGELYLPLIRR